MPRTWSYRKTDTILVKPLPGQPLAAKALIVLAFAVLAMVFISAGYFITHPYKDAIIVGPKSSSYQTIDPMANTKPGVSRSQNSGDTPLLDENH